MNSSGHNPSRAASMVNLTISLLLLCGICYSPPAARAAEWRVSPIRLELDRDTKSGVVSVINEGSGRFQVQMKAFRWEQDAEGKDQYTESSDIIFFPKIMIFDKPEERILRAGIKMPPGTKEMTYRLFIEEIPEPKKSEAASIAVAIRFGVPIFVKPVKEEVKGEITRLELSKGECRVTLKNSGNAHFIINAVNIKGNNLKGEQVFANSLGGWYLLHGASRVYSTAIPAEACTAAAVLDVEIKTDHFILHGKLDVDKSMCQ